MGTPEDFRYFAFISYSHHDQRWGDWLHRALETYRVPRNLIPEDGRQGPVPVRVFPVFRDREELPGSSDLSASINTALKSSRCMIVVCSPHSAKSLWVNEEIKAFKALGRENSVFCLVIDGEPNATHLPETNLEECFPEAIRHRVGSDKQVLAERADPIAADVRPGKDGRGNARLKLLAGILGVRYDDLRQRDQARRVRRTRVVVAASLALVGILSALSIGFYKASNSAEARLVESYRQQGVAANLAGNDQHALLYLDAVRGIVGDDSTTRTALADSWHRLAPLFLQREGDEVAAVKTIFSSDNTALLAQSESGGLRRVDLETSSDTLLAPANVGIRGNAMAQRANGVVTFTRRTNDKDVNLVDRSIEVLDQDGKRLASLPLPNNRPDPVWLILSANGNQVLIVYDDPGSEGVVQAWNIDSDTATIPQYELSESSGNLRFHLSDDGRHVAVTRYAGSDGFWLEIRGTETLEPIGRVDLPTRPESVMFLSSKRAGAKETSVIVGLVNGHLQRYDIVAGMPLVWSLETGSGVDRVSVLARDPTGERILAAGDLGSLSEHDPQTGAVLWRAPNRLPGVLRAAAYSPTGELGLVLDSSVLVAARESNQSQSDKLVEQFTAAWTGPQGSSIAFSKDGRQLAVGSEDGTLRAWQIETQPAPPVSRVLEMPNDERSFSTVTALEPGLYVLKGQNVYFFESGEPKPVKVAENAGISFARSPHHNVMASAAWGSLQVNQIVDGRATQTAALQVQGHVEIIGIQAKSAVSIVAALSGGGLMTFGTDGKKLPDAISGDGSSGGPVTVWAHQQGRYAAATFNDSSVIIGMLGENGITEVKQANVPGAPPSIIGGTSDALLLKNTSGLWLFDVNSEQLSSVTTGLAAAATVVTVAGKAHLAIVSEPGTLSLLDMEGELIAQNQPVQPPGGRPLLSSAGDRAGGSIAVHPSSPTGHGLLATSLNEYVYLWQLHDLRLLWRSPPITLGGLGSEKLRVIGFDKSGTRLLVGLDGMIGINTVAEITFPTKLPSREEARAYLGKVARLTLDAAGRAVER